jgi:hypothetical protein
MTNIAKNFVAEPQQPGKNNQERNARTGQPGQYCQKESSGKDNQERTARRGIAGKEEPRTG